MSHYQNFTPPFPIPDSWKWCKLSACCHIAGRIGFRGYTKEDLVCECNGAITLSPSNIVSDSMQYDTCTYISWAKYHESPEIQVQNNDILLVKTGSSFGKCALVKDLPKEATINPQFVVLKHIMVSPEYLTILLQSPYARKCYETFILGTAIPTFTQEKLGNLAVPVPPYREQLRIIQKLREIQSGVDSIILNKQELDSCIKQAKSKILDLAMQGKLVPQEPTDEPAADMLLRINPKAKIITDNPQCQNLPSGWTSCELRDLCIFLSRGKSPKYSEMQNQYPVFAQKCNLKDGGISLALARFLDESTLDKWPSKYHLLDGDILINSTGTGTVGRTRIFDNSCMGHYTFVVPDSHVSVARIFEDINSKYIFYCLYSNECQRYFEENLAGSTNQKELYIDIIGDRKIMLPPLKEQRRIVRKIEELYKVLNSIETSLQS